MAALRSRIIGVLMMATSAVGLCQCKHADHTPYDFSLTLEQTPDAQSRFTASRDDILITTYFYGEPSPQHTSETDDANRIRLGYQEQVYSGTARNVRIVSYNLDPKALAKTLDNKARVVITVSAIPSKSSPEVSPEQAQAYMIGCDSYVGPIDQLQKSRRTIRCDKYKP